jgi:hypothetical protein
MVSISLVSRSYWLKLGVCPYIMVSAYVKGVRIRKWGGAGFCQTVDGGEKLVCRFSYGGKAAYTHGGQGDLGRDAS